MESDTLLLTRYAESKDAEAFTELVRRHSGLVYATALRIVRDSHDAEDIAQTCFLEFAKKAGAVRRSLPGWLHCLSTSRAIDAARRKGMRQGHERQVAIASEAMEPTWGDISSLVDEALEELPEELRLPIIMRFFQGYSQNEVAQNLGVNQATVSRRLNNGIEMLRRGLKKAGRVASAGVLSTLLSENAAAGESAALTASLSKIGLAGVDGTTKVSGPTWAKSIGSGATGMGVLPFVARALAGLVIIVAVVGAVVAGFGLLRRLDASRPIPKHAVQPPAVPPTANPGSAGVTPASEDDGDGLRFVYEYFQFRDDPQLLGHFRTIYDSDASRDMRDHQLHALLDTLVPVFLHVAPVEVGKGYSNTVQKGDDTYLVECAVSPFQKPNREWPDPAGGYSMAFTIRGNDKTLSRQTSYLLMPNTPAIVVFAFSRRPDRPEVVTIARVSLKQ